MWPNSGFRPIDSPPIKKMPGRPKKKRMRSRYEPKKKDNKLTKEDRKMTCKICKKGGQKDDLQHM